MIEELLHAHRIVLLILPLPQAVELAVVAEQIRLLLVASKGEKVLDALIPGHRVVVIVRDDEDRGSHALDLEDRRVGEVRQGGVIKRLSDAALGLLVLELTRTA